LAAVKSALEDPHGNFCLYVSDQSFAISPVDIRVVIDGAPVLQQDFDVGSQHSWQKYTLRLTPGQHRIVAISKRGDAKFDETFEIDDKLWASLDYWYYPEPTGGASACPRHFSLHVSKEPIMFQ
jgi:hypothetical protein